MPSQFLFILGAVFTTFLVTGLAIPVLPLHVNRGLGLDTFVVGLVTGVQFAASLISRVWAGHETDARGGKRVLAIGFLASVLAGLCYLLSLLFLASPIFSVTILLVARAVLGAGACFIFAGAFEWGLSLSRGQNTGKIIAVSGMAIYVAYAIAAPIGTALYEAFGFGAIAVATTLMPLLSLILIAPLPGVVPAAQARPRLRTIAGAVWIPGVGLALSSVGFAAIITFVVLLFVEEGWSGAWIAVSALSVGFIVARLLFGHLPDRIGGAKVALIFGVVEAVGQAMIWLAPSSLVAFIGAAIAGCGYSMVYPAFGVEAVRRAPPQSRGLAMGAYTAFFDLALALSAPLLGIIATGIGLRAAFLMSTLLVSGCAMIALLLLYTREPKLSA